MSNNWSAEWPKASSNRMKIHTPYSQPTLKKARQGRADKRQKQFLIDYMVNHIEFASSKKKKRHTVKGGWAHLVNELNALGPAVKDEKSWRNTWRDIKSLVTGKINAIESQFGAAYLKNHLNEEELKVYGVLDVMSHPMEMDGAYMPDNSDSNFVNVYVEGSELCSEDSRVESGAMMNADEIKTEPTSILPDEPDMLEFSEAETAQLSPTPSTETDYHNKPPTQPFDDTGLEISNLQMQQMETQSMVMQILNKFTVMEERRLKMDNELLLLRKERLVQEKKTTAVLERIASALTDLKKD